MNNHKKMIVGNDLKTNNGLSKESQMAKQGRKLKFNRWLTH